MDVFLRGVEVGLFFPPSLLLVYSCHGAGVAAAVVAAVAAAGMIDSNRRCSLLVLTEITN